MSARLLQADVGVDGRRRALDVRDETVYSMYTFHRKQPMATRKTLKPIPARSSSKVAKAPAKRSTPSVSPPPMADDAGDPAVKAKQKLVRDSFTMPKNEYVLIDALKQRALGLGRPAKKSEILRAGVAVLSRMADADLLACFAAVPSLKTVRPRDASKPADRDSSRKKK